MKKLTKKLGKLSETELEVMLVIWGMAAPVTVSHALEVFAQRRGWKTSTLSTILDRLIEKGFLTKTLKGKANLYTPALTEDAYKEYETRMFLSSMHNGSLKSFIATLANGTGLSTEEVADIRTWFFEKAGDD